MKTCPCVYQEHPLEHLTNCASYVPPLTSEEIKALRALLARDITMTVPPSLEGHCVQCGELNDMAFNTRYCTRRGCKDAAANGVRPAIGGDQYR